MKFLITIYYNGNAVTLSRNYSPAIYDAWFKCALWIDEKIRELFEPPFSGDETWHAIEIPGGVIKYTADLNGEPIIVVIREFSTKKE